MPPFMLKAQFSLSAQTQFLKNERIEWYATADGKSIRRREKYKNECLKCQLTVMKNSYYCSYRCSSRDD